MGGLVVIPPTMTLAEQDAIRQKAVAERWSGSDAVHKHLRVTEADGDVFLSVRNTEVHLSPDEAEHYAEALWDAAQDARR